MKRKPGKRIERLTLEDFSERFSIDEYRFLYWDGQPVVTQDTLNLSKGQETGALIIIVFTIFAGLGSLIQGFTSYDTLACQMHWSWSYCSGEVQPALVKAH